MPSAPVVPEVIAPTCPYVPNGVQNVEQLDIVKATTTITPIAVHVSEVTDELTTSSVLTAQIVNADSNVLSETVTTKLDSEQDRLLSTSTDMSTQPLDNAAPSVLSECAKPANLTIVTSQPYCYPESHLSPTNCSYASSSSSPSGSSTYHSSPEQLAADDAIFKRPTSAVRRMSARQKAIVRKNLARRCKPTPSSYSIDRSFKRTRRKSSSVSAPSDLDVQSSERIGSRRSTKQRHPRGASTSPEKKRARLDDGETIDLDAILDCSRITSYFCVPVPMIEPIDDLDEADIAGAELAVPASQPVETDEPETATNSILLHDLFGDDSSSDDETDEPEIQQFETDESSATDELTAQPLDVLQVREPSPESVPHPYESDYSPASPPPPSSTDEYENGSFDTPIIPTETILPSTTSAFHQALSSFSHDKLKFLRRHGQPIDAADPQRYDRLHRIAQRYVNDPLFTAATAEACRDRLLAVCDGRRWLAAVLRELVEDIDADEPIDLANTPPVPPLTHSHQRIVLLVTMLDAELPGFHAYCMLCIEQTLFTFGTMNKKPSTVSMVNLVRYHVALADLRTATKPGSQRTRLFIYKCLYYFQHTATPLVYAVLQANPQCLPVLRSVHDEQQEPEPVDPDEFPVPPPRPLVFVELDPIVQVLHTVLQNTNYNEAQRMDAASAQLFKKSDMIRLLRQHYKYDPAQRRSYADLVQRMLQRIRDGRLRHVAEALILVGKRNGCDWTRRHLLHETVLPQMVRGLTRQWTTDADATLDERVVCLLHTIGSLAKPFPVTEDISSLQDLFSEVLAAAVGRPTVQEAAVSALLQTARFGAINVYRRVCHWQPEATIGEKLRLQLQTFVHRKPQTFWK